jgi:hypothetical protein
LIALIIPAIMHDEVGTLDVMLYSNGVLIRIASVLVPPTSIPRVYT